MRLALALIARGARRVVLFCKVCTYPYLTSLSLAFYYTEFLYYSLSFSSFDSRFYSFPPRSQLELAKS